MLDGLNRDERLLLVKFVCAYAWADDKVQSAERRFVERLAERFSFDEHERDRMEAWLRTPPEPDDIDPELVPLEHRRTFLEAVRAVLYADGGVGDQERAKFERLREALLGDD